nr:MAG TPA: hypothetical protein [Caudoviricetes sp.]
MFLMLVLLKTQSLPMFWLYWNEWNKSFTT